MSLWSRKKRNPEWSDEIQIEHHKGRAAELRRWGSTSDAQEHEDRVNDLLNKKK